MIEFFNSLNAEIAAACITAFITVFGGVAGLLVLVWRLGVEARRAIQQMREAEATKLKLRIYEEVVISTVDRVGDAQVALSSFIRRFDLDLSSYKNLRSRGMLGTTPMASIPTLNDLTDAFNDAAIGIVTIVESWLIVDPR